MEEIPRIFSIKKVQDARKEDELRASLYQQIGQLKVELDWLKKKLGSTVEGSRGLIEPGNEKISVSRQCELLGISRSGFYYKVIGESAYNLQLMRLIDEYYTGHPPYGVRRLTAWLRKEGHEVNHKRVNRLMREMGLYAIYPKPGLSKGSEVHKKYPYLLRGLSIEYPDPVWCADITYIRLNHGYVYLMAVMDWYSLYVLSWETSITLEVGFCLEALDSAIRKGSPEIFNTDQGTQFTSNAFTWKLEGSGVKISMDGRGRVFDNIFIERLWRSVKYEEVYLKDYKTVREVEEGLRKYFDFYNNERLHQSLEYRTPATLYFSDKKA